MIRFTAPIWIREDPLLIRTIGSPDEALAYLEAYKGDRGAVFHMAKQKLEKAVAGQIDADESRLEFWRFAGDVGILAESEAA